MFSNKKTKIFDVQSNNKPATNAFVQAATKQTSKTKSANGAEKFNSSGDDFVDQFNNLGVYKSPRSFQDIEKDCEKL